jgi:hypothetical protein
MKMRLSILAVLCMVVAALAAASTPAARADDGPTTYYLSLGDSLAASFSRTATSPTAMQRRCTPRSLPNSRSCGS